MSLLVSPRAKMSKRCVVVLPYLLFRQAPDAVVGVGRVLSDNTGGSRRAGTCRTFGLPRALGVFLTQPVRSLRDTCPFSRPRRSWRRRRNKSAAAEGKPQGIKIDRGTTARALSRVQQAQSKLLSPYTFRPKLYPSYTSRIPYPRKNGM